MSSDDAFAGPRAFLVVDDSIDMRFIVCRIVRRIHPEARIDEAGGAGDALERLRDAGEGDALVVVSDYDMGLGMSGTELLAEIARRHPRAARVLLTGHERDRIAAPTCSLHAVLPKDEGLQSLQACLRAMSSPVDASARTGSEGGLRLPGAGEGTSG